MSPVFVVLGMAEEADRGGVGFASVTLFRTGSLLFYRDKAEEWRKYPRPPRVDTFCARRSYV